MPFTATVEGSQVFVKLSFIWSFIHSSMHSFDNYCTHQCIKQCTALNIPHPSMLRETGHPGPRGLRAGDREGRAGGSLRGDSDVPPAAVRWAGRWSGHPLCPCLWAGRLGTMTSDLCVWLACGAVTPRCNYRDVCQSLTWLGDINLDK